MVLLLLLKIVVSVLVVLLLSSIAERVSTRVAGVLSGYPLGTAITLFFIGVEQGPEFVSEAAFHTCLGFVATLALAGTYYFFCKNQSAGNVLLTCLVSAGVFLITAKMVSFFPATPWTAIIVPLTWILVASCVFSGTRNIKIRKRRKSTRNVILARALLAAMIVITVTGLAEVIGPAWSGLLSAFPVTVFPLLLILHYSYGPDPVKTLIKHYPFGLVSLVLYAFSVHWSYPLLGVYIGTIVSLLLATFYLVLYYLFQRWWEGRSSPNVNF